MWKHPKPIYRVYCEMNDDDLGTHTWHDDFLVSELTPDLMSDYYTHHDWLFWSEKCDWKITKVEEVHINSWKQANLFRHKGFYFQFGDGENIHI